MERWYQISFKLYIMSQWTLVVILLLLPQYSECVCAVPNCNSSSPCTGHTCYSCNDGYYLQYGSCMPCQQSLLGCTTCSSGSSCTKCTDGYYLQSGSCIQCPDRCATCSSSTLCTTCKDTYWNENNNICYSHCPDNCLNRRCNGTTGFCYSCISGKYGPQCGQDCSLCKDGQCDLRKCTHGCKDGYYQKDSNGYSYCWKCVDDNCLTCLNGTYCNRCEQGYYRNYYRQTSGRGTMNCLQCYGNCMNCSSTEHCHEDCIHHCSEPVNPGTTMSTHKSTTIQRTSSKLTTSKTEPLTQTQKISEAIKSTESTPYEELCKDLNCYQRQIKTCSECRDQNQLTFGHGLATGIGISFALFGCGVGIALFIRRQTKQHKHTDENSEGHHEYVNTNMTDILSVVSSENNEVTNDIHTVSSDLTNTGVTNIDSSRDYVMLGDRPTHESDYTDLQNT